MVWLLWVLFGWLDIDVVCWSVVPSVVVCLVLLVCFILGLADSILITGCMLLLIAL